MPQDFSSASAAASRAGRKAVQRHVEDVDVVIKRERLMAWDIRGKDVLVTGATSGKYAEVIAVRGTVLRHVEPLQDVDLVIKRGVRYR
jgi:hypothetical protein